MDYVSGVTFKRGDGGTPTEAFTTVPGLVDYSGFGQDKPEVDVTDFDSSDREYITGLADGKTMSLTFHDDLDSASNTELESLKTDADAGTVRNVQLVRTDGTNTKTYDFALALLGWELQDGVGEAAKVQITGRISGGITVS